MTVARCLLALLLKHRYTVMVVRAQVLIASMAHTPRLTNSHCIDTLSTCWMAVVGDIIGTEEREAEIAGSLE